ncbi:uncharacterized protein IAS62_004303 [Cryptococcus decagattii]|uniref:Uncharacterized protein n=1 Tax=Cryptococcus decagattii TaxID=1859122 RepID=A0ABZ2AX22_9TREE
MINNLTKVHPTELGGFRIEIRLKARTLNQARVTTRSLPFFSIDSWLNPTEDEIKPFKLEAMAITKEDLLQNAVEIRAIAYSRDICWNPGRRRLSRPIKSGAWWREPDDGGKRTAWEIILGHSAAKYSSSASLRRLFKVCALLFSLTESLVITPPVQGIIRRVNFKALLQQGPWLLPQSQDYTMYETCTRHH